MGYSQARRAARAALGRRGLDVHILIEGPDFSGKTTVARRISEALMDRSTLGVMQIREPSPNTPTGAEIRKMLASGAFVALSPSTQYDLMARARAELAMLVDPTKQETLRRRTVIVQDRGFLSSVAYNGVPLYRAWLDMPWTFSPDIVLILLPSKEELAARVKASNRAAEAWDDLPSILEHRDAYIEIVRDWRNPAAWGVPSSYAPVVWTNQVARLHDSWGRARIRPELLVWTDSPTKDDIDGLVNQILDCLGLTPP